MISPAEDAAAAAQSRHAELAAELRRHDHAYYVLAQPAVSDHEYDALYTEVLELERQFPWLITPDSPSQRVGGAPAEGFRRIEHLQPMLSLEKIAAADIPTKDEEPDREKRGRLQDENTLAQLRAFDVNIRKHLGRDRVEYVMEPKVDGVSLGVHYRHGKLTLGVTRGDGRFGDDITANLRTVRAIPLELQCRAGVSPAQRALQRASEKVGEPSASFAGADRRDACPTLLEVRGEAYMAIQDFDALNGRLAAAGEKALPNARNGTAGTLKQLDPRIVAQRPIRAVFYAVGAYDGIAFATHAEMLMALAQFGLPTQRHWWLCDGIEEVIARYRDEVVCHYDESRDLRRQLPYEIDGIVVKVNRLADWARIPAKTRAPGYAIVHKPIPWITPAETVLKAITVQVGRTGVLTPVAELEPVFVQGSTVARATLHNEDEIRRKDIRIGDTVVIRKAGMVIPEVFEVMKTRRPPGAAEFDLFQHLGGRCPACGGPIAKDKVSAGAAEEVAWRCQNVAGCPAQKTRRVEYFAQRKALDIESLGGIVAEKLIERGLVSEPLDLFNLTREQLAALNLGTDDEPRVFGEKNATKVIEALERARIAPLNRWIHALAIPEIGEQTAWQLAQVHGSFDELASSPVLQDIRTLGDKETERALVSPQSRKNPPKSELEKIQRKSRTAELAAAIAVLEARLTTNGGRASLAEVGPVAAASLLNFFASEVGRKTRQRLHELGIHPVGAKTGAVAAHGAGPFAGQTFVLTGTLPGLSRDEALALIREGGGGVSSSVGKSTDYVLAGAEAGAKLAKARQLGVRVLDEAEFRQMLAKSP